jgi:hypothetical protein
MTKGLYSSYRILSHRINKGNMTNLASHLIGSFSLSGSSDFLSNSYIASSSRSLKIERSSSFSSKYGGRDITDG